MLERQTLAELAEKTFLLGLRFAAAPDPADREGMRGQADGTIERFRADALAAGHGEEAVELAAAGLRCYVDEKARRRLGDAPDGGERFFDLLRKAESSEGLLQAKQVFLLCLVFGFEGRYAADGSEQADDALLREAEGLWQEAPGVIAGAPATP